MAAITLDGLRKTYAGGVEAVKGISLNIADGEFIVLVGPSGCGKSSLLRMIAGLEEINEGTLKIGERVMNKVEPADRDIAMVFQNYALYPHMSVFNNLAYGLKNRGVPKKEIAERVQKTAEILELGPYLNRKPQALSGGQRQRVAMGRAIVREPAAFLFDEPLSNLDAKLRVQMRMEIKKLQRSLGTTSIYVTHDQLEAMTLADRLVVLNKGEVEQIGTPMEIYEKPASVFTAGFIGSPAMNLIQLELQDGMWRTNCGEPIGLPSIPAETQVTLGIRPEDLRIVEKSGSSERGLEFEMNVSGVEPVGAESYIHGTLGKGAEDVVVRISGKTQVRAGENLQLYASTEAVHLFNFSTGKRMADLKEAVIV
ncbi:sn-glycerol-3-phosphate import ATP-binding protein UgpC [Flexibacterium corallicola]|uniref:sn-glycerol-3-phosphate import ATP-binding protein UgpC n=1 Tax=Flexibacterium corallicola TaxID=3037259 RepID=UPI00286F17FD|nr:sn-glycerol-3-phosphate import ATP-binding protein UgpC [Pseudovibrio sp. M1P-2-3]